jgi:hypothetical protein
MQLHCNQFRAATRASVQPRAYAGGAPIARIAYDKMLLQFFCNLQQEDSETAFSYILEGHND